MQANDGENTNHGGREGFNSRVSNYEITGDSLVFTLYSKDGDGGFPGNLTLTITYSLQKKKLRIAFTAVTDKTTVANLPTTLI